MIDADPRKRFHADLRAKLPAHAERATWSAERIADHQRDQLRLLLAHAKEHSRYYAERLRNIDPSTFELEDLRRLPVLHKTEMMEHFDDIATVPELRRDAVEAHLERSGAELDLLADHLCLASGGSSGQRGVYLWRWDAMSDYTLGCLRRSLAQVAALGAGPGEVAFASVSAPAPIHATNAIGALLSGDLLEVHRLSATWPIERIVAELDGLQPLGLTAFPSVLVRLAREQQAGRLNLHLLAVSGTSEPFPAAAQTLVAQAFGIPPTNVFGSTEGLCGSSVAGEIPIDLSCDLAIVELVDSHGAPVPPGTPSSRVLVTNLVNRTQPLVRFVLDDSMVQQPPAADHGHIRVTVDGRSDEAFRYGDTVVHPITVRSVMVHQRHIAEYRVHQTEDGIILEVLESGPVDHDALTTELAHALADAGMPAAQVHVQRSDYIPAHPQTGKVQRFVSMSR
jgi:phenylacetate-CoA ligase